MDMNDETQMPENERKATGNAGANSDVVEQRDTNEKEPPSAAQVRRGDRAAAGADTPAGPNPSSGTEKAKKELEKQADISARDRKRLESGG
jgi:hypothetical protein